MVVSPMLPVFFFLQAPPLFDHLWIYLQSHAGMKLLQVIVLTFERLLVRVNWDVKHDSD